MTTHKGAPRSFFQGPAASALVPFSWLYGRAAAWKRRWGTRRAQRLTRPVISIGNITCGGTGKTPAVEMVARSLLALGLKPAILSRGYGGPARPGNADVRGNDELLVLSANLPEVPHYQSRDRIAIGREAIAKGAQVLILDDGFQHVRLRRDVDFVLIDALSPFGHGRVLPAGLLREPLDALALASLLGISRSDQVAGRTLATLRTYLQRRFPGVPQVELATRPIEWVSLGGERLPPARLAGRRVLAFCGLGNPEAFRRQLVGLDVEILRFWPFRDHHSYTPRDLAQLQAARVECGADEVVMTQKDAVKIPASGHAEDWKYLRIETQVVQGHDVYARALQAVTQQAITQVNAT